MDFNSIFNELKEEFGFEEKDNNKIKYIYNTLQTKECFSSDNDQERIFDCIYRIFFELSEIENRKDNNNIKKNDFINVYRLTLDYAINKGIFLTYQRDSINDLSEDFIMYLSKEINYNGKSELDNFYDENNIETHHYR